MAPAYKIVYTKAAIEHIKNVADWYNKQQNRSIPAVVEVLLKTHILKLTSHSPSYSGTKN